MGLRRPAFLTSSSGACCGRRARHNESAPACWRDAQLCGSVAAHSMGPVLFPPLPDCFALLYSSFCE